jgi:putative ABC transport system permease protein
MKLFCTFVVRPLWSDKLRTLLSVMAVALGIAAVVAIRLANRSAIASFQESVTQITGRANLSIAGLTPFDEDLLARAYEAFAGRQSEIELSPVVAGVAVEVDSREALDVLAVDLATDQAVRDTAVEGLGSARDMLLLLTDPGSLLIGRGFAVRHRLRPGSAVSLTVNGRQRAFRVRGILSESGPGAAPARIGLAGNIAVMDIAAGQLLFGRLGRLDRIDLVIPPEHLDDARRRLAPLLPPGVKLERPQARSEQVEKMLRAFRLNLSALSLVSLIVGAFLIYNTVAVSVVRRRPEVGALRAVGATRGRVILLFLAEAVMLGLAGSALGIGLGRLLANQALALVAGTVNSLWFPLVPSPVNLDWRLAVLALGIGAGVALLSALLPAREAADVEPAEALRRGAHEHRRQLRRNRDAAAGLVVLLAAYGLARLPALDSRPLFGYGAAILLVGGFALLMPLAMTVLSRVASAALARMNSVAGMLAARSLSASLGRASVLAMALATAIAMMASVAILVTSFRRTVDLWAAQTFRADLFIRPAGASGGGPQRAAIDLLAIQAIAATPGVAAVDAFRAVEITFRGNPAFVACGGWDVLRRYGNLMFLDGRRAGDVMRPGPGLVVISEPFSLRNQVRQGDTILLPTPAGDRPFRVAGVYYDYTSDRGYAVMDRSDWLRYGGGPEATSLAVYLQPGAGAERIRQALSERTASRALLITLNREVKANVMRIFDRTFAITWVLEAIAISVAVLGIANALLALVLERRRELGILRYLGASGRQLRRLVVIEAALLGLLACAAGLLLGFVLSLVLIYVINRQSFGWTIQFSLPVGFLALATLAIYAVTCLSALFPARQAARIDPVDAVLVE